VGIRRLRASRRAKSDRARWTVTNVRVEPDCEYRCHPTSATAESLRFHPRCSWRNESTGKSDFISAVIVPFRSIDDDAITTVHRIALNSDGTKLDRRMRGVVHRAAIKLDPLGKQLAIGEGLETAMTARQLG